MEIILLEDVEHLGAVGTLQKVANGYAHNYLLPKKLAIIASTKNKRQLEHQLRLANFRQQKVKAAAEQLAESLQTQLMLTIARKVGEQNKLFGSVTVQDIQEALAQAGVQIDRRKLILSEPIKALGEYRIPVRLPGNIKSEVRLAVVAES